jgi:RNA polymerase sigma-70 factor (ECF subfamily)
MLGAGALVPFFRDAKDPARAGMIMSESMNTSGRPREPIDTEALFRAHASFVARLLTRLGVGGDELDDAVQEVFLVVHRNGGYVPGPATPTGYLTSIALRVASSHRRRGRKRRERRSDVAPDDVSSANPDPARSLEVNQSLAELQGALDALEPDMRATLVLAELEGESCLSIAAMMQTAVGTVYWRLHRARKTFRAAIANRRAAERRPEALAAGAVLFAPSAEGLLDAARSHPGVTFDVDLALERLRLALRSGAPIPPWVAAATPSGVASGVGLTAPAILSALVLVHAAGTGVSHWNARRVAAPPQAVTAANIASIAPGPVGLFDVAAAPVNAPSVDVPPADAIVQSTAPAATGRALPARRESVAAAARPSPTQPTVELAESPTMADPPAAVDAPGPDAMREIQEVAEAQRLLTSDPARSLALVRASEARTPSGYLREERRYVGVIALFKLGRVDEARTEAGRFLADYPDGPYSARIRAAR